MATAKQVSYLESLNSAAIAAGDPGLTADVLTRAADLTHDDVQHWIGHLKERIPATNKQLKLIFDFHGGLGHLPPDQEAGFRAMRRHEAHAYIRRVVLDPHAKKAISEAKWAAERLRRDEQLKQRAARAVEMESRQRAESEKDHRAWLERQQAEVEGKNHYEEIMAEELPNGLLDDILAELTL